MTHPDAEATPGTPGWQAGAAAAMGTNFGPASAQGASSGQGAGRHGPAQQGAGGQDAGRQDARATSRPGQPTHDAGAWPSPPPASPPRSRPDPSPRPADDSRIRSARGSILFGFFTIALLACVLLGWGLTAQIAGAVIANGSLTVAQQRQVVQHPDGGVVARILVREGDFVTAGDVLLDLDSAEVTTELAVVESQYYEILARRGRLEAEIAGADTVRFPPALAQATHDARIATLVAGQTALLAARRDTRARAHQQQRKQADQIRAQIAGISAQIRAQSEQQSLLQRELADAQSLLDKGLMQAARVFALEREAASVAGRIGELESAAAQAEARITEIDIEQLRSDAAEREAAEGELRDLGYREIEMAERRQALRTRLAGMEIRAPVSGIVHQLQVTTPRSVIRPAEPLMHLVPQDQPLIVAAKVAATNIDEVHQGREAVLRFPSFSPRTTPEITATVDYIAADAVSDEAGQMPYYPIELVIPESERARLGGRELLPGMPVEVFIHTEDRTPMQYLLKPFADYFSRAMRES